MHLITACVPPAVRIISQWNTSEVPHSLSLALSHSLSRSLPVGSREDHLLSPSHSLMNHLQEKGQRLNPPNK